jgi:hypothetical protein
VVAITAVEQTDLGDGTKLIFARIGIKNNDLLWGTVTGPDIPVETKSQESIILTTEDGSVYPYLHDPKPTVVKQLSETNQRLYEATGQIKTPLLPPKFATLGKLINGEPSYYNFAFQIPSSKTPDTIIVDGIQVNCIQPHVIGENGQPVYRKKNIQLPARTYTIDTDIGDFQDELPAGRYPNLVGAELILPDWKEIISVTDVTKDGNKITVVFDFSNYSSHDVSPSFNGYIIGNNHLFICQEDCEQKSTHETVQSGQAAYDLTWTFTVPEGVTNLMFVYVYGGNVDLNEVYIIDLE